MSLAESGLQKLLKGAGSRPGFVTDWFKVRIGAGGWSATTWRLYLLQTCYTMTTRFGHYNLALFLWQHSKPLNHRQ
jgi:hypothetical protein